MTAFRGADRLGVRACPPGELGIDTPGVHSRVKALALAQSADIRTRLRREGVALRAGTGRFAATQPVRAGYAVEIAHDGETETVPADVVLLATGGSPRVLPDAEPGGARSLDWRPEDDPP